MIAGRPFLTYKEATLFLQGLPTEERDAAYAEMKAQGLATRSA